MKTNPRRKPRTQADVDRAYDKGMSDGSICALTVMLYCLKDKFGATDDQLNEFSKAFNRTIEAMNEGYVTESDLKTVIREEYGTVIKIQ